MYNITARGLRIFFLAAFFLVSAIAIISSCATTKDPIVQTMQGKILLEQRLTYFPQEIESGDTSIYAYDWLAFGSTTEVDPSEKIAAVFGYTNDYELVLLQGDSVQVLQKNIVSVGRTFLFQNGKKIPCIGYTKALGGAWNIITVNGKILATAADKIQYLPKFIEFIEGESKNLVVTGETGNKITILR